MLRTIFAGALAAVMGALPARADDVRIGAVFPMSGPNAIYGDIFGAGANLAVEHANADKLLSGKPVIDLVRIASPGSRNGHYQGICW